MAKNHIILILFSAWMLVTIANGESIIMHQQNEALNSTFRVYVHEYIGGPNATLHEIARAGVTADSATQFGLFRLADDSMTSGPEAESDGLGRAQGYVINSGLTESVIMVNVDFVFTAGDYEGGVITILGWKRTSNVNEEIPIVGGSGVFRSACGYTVSSLYSYDAAANYIVMVYDFYLKLGVSSADR